MTKKLYGLLLLVGVHSANAQTPFTFAGSSWGESIQTFDTKLKQAGFTGCEWQEKMLCSTRTICTCTFDGSTIRFGRANFTNQKMDSVTVGVQNQEATSDTLKKKYGPPLPTVNNPKLTPYLQYQEQQILRWRNAKGDTLVLDQNSVLEYTSGEKVLNQEKNKRTQDGAY